MLLNAQIAGPLYRLAGLYSAGAPNTERMRTPR